MVRPYCFIAEQFAGSECEDAAVDWICLAGDERRLVGTQVQRERRDFFWRAHSAERLILRQLPKHLGFAARICRAQVTVDERSMNARGANTIASDAALHVID